MSLSVVLQSVSAPIGTQYPLVCQGITGGQWYQPNGVLFPLATPDPVSTPGGYGQRNVSRGVELYRGTPSVFPHGFQCCTNATVTLCVGMYSDLTLAASVNLPKSNGYNYALSVAATCKYRGKCITCVKEVLSLPQMVLTSRKASSLSC